MKKIGLVGLGFIGKIHLEAYQQIENCQVKSIFTRNIPEKQGLQLPFDGKFVADFEEILRDPEIDIIDICLPTYLHETYILKAAQAGKHIICEKPLTLTLESANRIVQAITTNNVKLFVAHVLRFWPEYQLIKLYSESDYLTNINVVHASRLGQAPAWSKWFQDPAKSGGALFDLHIHDIDFLYYLLGPVKSVYAVGMKNKYGAWNHVMTTLIFLNKTKAFIEASQRMPVGFPFTMEFRAQAGQNALDLRIAAGENIEHIHESDHSFMFYSGREKTSIKIEKSDAFQNELAYFVKCVETNQDNRVIPIADVIYTLKLLKAIEHSLETKKEVQVL